MSLPPADPGEFREILEYYSAIERKEVLIHAKIRMRLENTMLNEKDQSLEHLGGSVG